ncbi:MAG: ABC transporter permease [Euryarchaeota archaeon]|nr:ABC transporter permease [Euryarchaeota archaeon]
MNARRMLGFTRRMLLQFRHDRRTLGFVIGMPLLMMLAFGYTFGGEVSHVKVDIVNLDSGIPSVPMFSGNRTVGNRVIDKLNRDTLELTASTDWEASKGKVDRNEAWAAIRFQPDFSQDFLLSANATPGALPARIEIYIDGSSPNIAQTVLKVVTNAYLAAINKITEETGQSARKIPIEPDISYAYGGGDTKFIDYFAPAIMSMAIMMVTTMLTIILFVYERRSGTLQRLLVSPATASEIVFGYALAFAVLGLLQSLVILFAAMLIFNITVVGNIAVALLVILLLAFVHQGLGILLSASAKNELQAIQFIPLVLFPSILLAGMFWPVESIPQFLQPVSYCVPLRYGIDAMRSVMLRGWGLEHIWPQVLVLVLMACLTLGGAVLQLRRRK